ncbi:hypothetical protein Tco_0375878 [Tanacetum coccineum]
MWWGGTAVVRVMQVLGTNTHPPKLIVERHVQQDVNYQRDLTYATGHAGHVVEGAIVCLQAPLATMNPVLAMPK